jgi:hypothetical protein
MLQTNNYIQPSPAADHTHNLGTAQLRSYASMACSMDAQFLDADRGHRGQRIIRQSGCSMCPHSMSCNLPLELACGSANPVTSAINVRSAASSQDHLPKRTCLEQSRRLMQSRSATQNERVNRCLLPGPVHLNQRAQLPLDGQVATGNK